MRHQVEADQIGETEDAGLGNTQRFADHGVGHFHRNAHAERFQHGGLDPVDTDTVGDESGGVLAVDHALAQTVIAEYLHGGDRIVTGLAALDDLQQTHVARRIEEVGDEEILGKPRRHVGHQMVQRNGRGVGRDQRTRFTHSVDLAIEVLLDVETFDHRFDDPVAVGQQFHVVFDVTGGDQSGIALVHKGRRIGLEQFCYGRVGDDVTVLRPFRNDIEQHHRHPGIGHVSGDTRPHDAGADDSNLVDFHYSASRMVAMPCPPPMHWVESANCLPSRCNRVAALAVIRAPLAPSG